MKFYNKYSYQSEFIRGIFHERNTLPSKTLPDQAMTVKQLIDRFQRGLPVTGQMQGEYSGEDDVLNGIDLRTLDISEKHEIIDNFNKELQDIEQRKKNRAAEAREKRAEDARAALAAKQQKSDEKSDEKSDVKSDVKH